jgi:hypothetical protein
MTGDGEEVGVLAEQLRVVADGDRGDQAVGELARRLAPAAAEPVQLSGISSRERISARSPAQPVPSVASASSRLIVILSPYTLWCMDTQRLVGSNSAKRALSFTDIHATSRTSKVGATRAPAPPSRARMRLT